MNILDRLNSIEIGKKKVREDDDGIITSANFAPKPPRVDLLPERVRIEARTRRGRKFAYVGAATSAVAITSLFAIGFLDSRNAANELDEARAMQSDASVELAQYAPVTNLAAQTKSLLGTVQNQEQSSIDHQEVLNRFLAASGANLIAPTVSIATNGSGGCVSTDPFNQVSLAGCITFSGEGDPTALLRSLGGEPWFSDAFIPSVGQGENGVQTISGSVGINMSALPTAETEETPEEGQ